MLRECYKCLLIPQQRCCWILWICFAFVALFKPGIKRERFLRSYDMVSHHFLQIRPIKLSIIHLFLNKLSTFSQDSLRISNSISIVVSNDMIRWIMSIAICGVASYHGHNKIHVYIVTFQSYNTLPGTRCLFYVVPRLWNVHFGRISIAGQWNKTYTDMFAIHMIRNWYLTCLWKQLYLSNPFGNVPRWQWILPCSLPKYESVQDKELKTYLKLTYKQMR